MPAFIDDTCTNCKLCEPVCPTKSIFQGKRQFVVDTDTCLSSGVCVAICPVQAIKIKPRLGDKKPDPNKAKPLPAKKK